MPYRRFPAVYRRYNHWLPDPSTDSVPEPAENLEVEKVSKVEEFPLPNIAESSSPPADNRLERGPVPSFLSSILSRITIEDLLLLGVIIVLFDGGLQDELLLIMLIYILLT